MSVTTTRPAHASSAVGEHPIKCGLKDGHAQIDQFLFDALSENYSFSSMVASASQRKNWSYENFGLNLPSSFVLYIAQKCIYINYGGGIPEFVACFVQ